MDIIQIDTDPHSIYMELDTIDGLHEFDGQLIQWHVMWLTVLKKEQFHIFYGLISKRCSSTCNILGIGCNWWTYSIGGTIDWG